MLSVSSAKVARLTPLHSQRHMVGSSIGYYSERFVSRVLRLAQ